MKLLLRAEGLSAGYRGKTVFSQVDLQLHEGELVALLGRNASGKTTLLRALAGLQPLTAGRVLMEGADAAGLSRRARAKGLSYLPQRRELFSDLPCLEMALMGVNPELGPLEHPTPAHRERAWAALARLGLADLAATGFWQLSEGQRQLVMLARCLTQNAPVMLFDEPDGALDFVNRHEALSQIAALCHEDGRAGLATLHDPNLALSRCDRVLVLARGRLAGEFCPATASREEIEAALRLAFGEVALLHDGRRFVMTKGEAQDGLGN